MPAAGEGRGAPDRRPRRAWGVTPVRNDRRGAGTAGPERWHARDTGRGVLESEEHLTWTGPWPPAAGCGRACPRSWSSCTSAAWSGSPSVCCAAGAAPGAWSAASWAPGRAWRSPTAGRRASPYRVERRWTIDSGFLARPVAARGRPPRYGTLALGVERVAAGRLHAWAAGGGVPGALPRAGPVRAGVLSGARGPGWAGATQRCTRRPPSAACGSWPAPWEGTHDRA